MVDYVISPPPGDKFFHRIHRLIYVISPHSSLILQNFAHSPLILHIFALNGGDTRPGRPLYFFKYCRYKVTEANKKRKALQVNLFFVLEMRFSVLIMSPTRSSTFNKNVKTFFFFLRIIYSKTVFNIYTFWSIFLSLNPYAALHMRACGPC